MHPPTEMTRQLRWLLYHPTYGSLYVLRLLPRVNPTDIQALVEGTDVSNEVVAYTHDILRQRFEPDR